MLEPQDRRHLLEMLRPPPGYRLDCGLGTTYSLDLLSLLMAPAACALLGWQEERRDPRQVDPVLLMEVMRRFARRLTVFCQAGRISVPRAHQLLYHYLESSVVEVLAPHPGRAFHPKVWALRYVGSGGEVRYRLLCLSRNLTFDRSWDTVLVLEGALAARVRAFGDNNPLGEFIAALPGMARGPLPAGVEARVEQVQHEIRRVRFGPPPGVQEVHFHPLGIGRADVWPFPRDADRLLVFSPFLAEPTLIRLTEGVPEAVLVSRVETLERVRPSALTAFDRIYAFDPDAAPEPDDAESGDEEALSGLHAKLYVADIGREGRIWTGSANATQAAFGGNVEFLVALHGSKSACGVAAFLPQNESGDGRKDARLQDLLQPFGPGDVTTPDPVEESLQRALEATRAALSAASLSAEAELSADDEYRVTLCCTARVALPSEVQVRCWPITLLETAAVPVVVGGPTLARFDRVSLASLTTFYAFAVTAAAGQRQGSCRFVLSVPVAGLPEGREARVLRTILRDKEGLVRFLLMLLTEDDAEAPEELPDGPGIPVPGGGPLGMPGATPLFEALVRTYSREPWKLDHVARLIADLRRTEGGAGILPEGLLEVWEPIWAAREEDRT